jgi:hypothetical protein
MVKIFSSMMAAIGRQLKQSVNVFQSLMLYRRLPTHSSTPHRGGIPCLLTFVVETVDSVDTGALVVASEDEEVFGVFDLVREQQADGLERLLSSVDIVSKEEVVGLWGEGSVLEQTQQIVILAVDIT